MCTIEFIEFSPRIFLFYYLKSCNNRKKGQVHKVMGVALPFFWILLVMLLLWRKKQKEKSVECPRALKRERENKVIIIIPVLLVPEDDGDDPRNERLARTCTVIIITTLALCYFTHIMVSGGGVRYIRNGGRGQGTEKSRHVGNNAWQKRWLDGSFWYNTTALSRCV